MTITPKLKKATIFLGLVSILAFTNAYAQIPTNSLNPSTSEGVNTMSMNDKAGSSHQSTISNADNFTGSISIFQPIINEFKSSINTSLTDAISTAEQSLGNNATTLAAFIHPEREYIVYNVYALDANNIAHRVIVDPGNGNILSSQQMSFMEMMMMLHGDSDKAGPHGMGMMDYDKAGP
ncbi:MAG: hypothetical protein WKF36_08300, partial [Candidatus Nitrosocosmicus sp.]